ncbi:MAG: NAD(P)-dependent oxidoreductase [Verrucomicrobia bacterium]|nr:NAD(P)-dependent oxidoreductase [Verrucomicrobiota bacterium]
MKSRGAILITGAQGYIGRRLAPALAAAGWQVSGLDRPTTQPPPTLAVDLLDAAATERACGALPALEAVVHLAALAHHQRPPPGETCFSFNTRTTANLLGGLRERQPQFLLFSSVAVYGEEGREGAVPVTAPLRPGSEYGRSKRACEEMLSSSGLANVDVLRLAPVFDPSNLRDVRKRVFAPGLPIRVRWLPAPRYSLCHLETVVRTVLQLLDRGPAGRRIQHVADPEPYVQSELTRWFRGPMIRLPVAWTRPVYWLLRSVPGESGYALRCLYCKLVESNVYALGNA